MDNEKEVSRLDVAQKMGPTWQSSSLVPSILQKFKTALIIPLISHMWTFSQVMGIIPHPLLKLLPFLQQLATPSLPLEPLM